MLVLWNISGYTPRGREPHRESLFLLSLSVCETPGGHDLWRVRLITMRPARIHKEISQILIQLSRLMAAGLWRRWRPNDLSRGKREERPPPSGSSSRNTPRTAPVETTYRWGILDQAKRVNGRGPDLLSFGLRVVTNLRDRVTVRLTTTRRRNATS